MATTIHSKPVTLKNSKVNTVHTGWLQNLADRAETIRFGLIPYLLVFIGCMGGIAAGLGAPGHAVELAMVVLPTSLLLAFILAVAPMRLIITMSILSLVMDIIVLII